MNSLVQQAIHDCKTSQLCSESYEVLAHLSWRRRLSDGCCAVEVNCPRTRLALEAQALTSMAHHPSRAHDVIERRRAAAVSALAGQSIVNTLLRMRTPRPRTSRACLPNNLPANTLSIKSKGKTLAARASRSLDSRQSQPISR